MENRWSRRSDDLGQLKQLQQKLAVDCERYGLDSTPLLIGIVLVAASASIPTLAGKVVSIADGDTLTLLVDKTQIKVRLEGIGTPERAQPVGQKARQALAKKVFGRVVQVDDLGKDRYLMLALCPLSS